MNQITLSMDMIKKSQEFIAAMQTNSGNAS